MTMMYDVTVNRKENANYVHAFTFMEYFYDGSKHQELLLKESVNSPSGQKTL